MADRDAPFERRIELGHEPPFALGRVQVCPPLREITFGTCREVLEPRVMQVLIALAKATGEIVTRDDLIESCWHGTVVGENAIQRAISRLRQISEARGLPFRIDTVSRVGYRLLVVEEQAAATESKIRTGRATAKTPSFSRRALGFSAAGLAGTAALGMWIWRSRKVPINPQALDLYRRGQLLQRTGEPGTMDQAMAFYKQAIELAPEFADAWGAMAIGYYHAATGFSDHDRAAYVQLMRSAAERALEIDPGQADAAMALVMAKGYYGRLTSAERDLRQLVTQYPDYWYANAQLGIFLREVGRIRDSLPFTLKTLSLDLMLPVGWSKLAVAQMQAGQVQEADLTLDQAAGKWPANGPLWFARYIVLIQTGRYDEAQLFVRAPRTRPQYMAEDTVSLLARTAGALTGANADARRAVTRDLVDIVNSDSSNAPFVASLLAPLGEAKQAMEMLDRYFPPASRKPTELAPFELGPLFYPTLTNLRDDPDYSRLLVKTGLEDYWKQSGSQPDFRQA